MNRKTRVKYIPPSSDQRAQADRRERRSRDPYPLTELLTNISDSGTQGSGRNPEGSLNPSDRSLDDGVWVEHEVVITHENP